jgi:hypothetical protein
MQSHRVTSSRVRLGVATIVQLATRLAATSTPHTAVRMASTSALLLVLFAVVNLAVPTLARGQVTYDRTLSFSGYTWAVKASTEPVGPGPNHFSDSTKSVWVDKAGRLHLRIRREGGTWLSAEVVSILSFGHGTYRFYLERAVHRLPPLAVLGLFTWNNDDPAFFHREIDIEFSRWGNAKDPTNAQYVVQPYDQPGNLLRFTEPGVARSNHSVSWLPDSVSFQSLRGSNPTPQKPSDMIQEWTTTQGIPPAGDEHVRINLWLFHGLPTANKASVEIVFSRFEFTPAP